MNYDFSPIYQLNILSNQVNVRVDRMVRSLFDVSLTEWKILAIVAGEAGTTQQRVIDLVCLDRSVVSRGIQSLKKRGMIEAKTDNEDARRFKLYLSATGLTLYEQSHHLAIEGDEALLTGFNAQERDTLFSLLARISDNMDKVGIIS